MLPVAGREGVRGRPGGTRRRTSIGGAWIFPGCTVCPGTLAHQRPRYLPGGLRADNGRGVFPFFPVGFEQRPGVKWHMFNKCSTRACACSTSARARGLGTARHQKCSVLSAQVDDAAHGTFDGAAPDRISWPSTLHRAMRLMILDEVVAMRANCLTVAPSTDHPHRRNDLLHLALQQQVRCWVRHQRARFRTQSCAEPPPRRGVARLIKVQQFMHSLSRSSRAPATRRGPAPDPRRPSAIKSTGPLG